MTLITETLSLPGGVTPTSALVEVRLVGNNGAPIEGFVDGISIVSSHLIHIKASDNGAWSLNLAANAAIIPSGAAWRRIVTVPASAGRTVADDYLTVPTSGGPYRVDQILTTAPASIAPPGAVSYAQLTAAVQAAVDALLAGAPGALDTLKELADALGDDANFAATVTTALAGKVAKAGDTITGPLVLPGNPGVALHAAPKQYVDAETARAIAAEDANTAAMAASSAAISAEVTARTAGDVARGPTIGSDAWLKLYASSPDLLVTGAITRDTNGAATAAAVEWPDGSVGTYTADTLSAAFPGAVDAYHVTFGSPVTKTATQPTVTRDATTGAVTVRPALVVA